MGTAVAENGRSAVRSFALMLALLGAGGCAVGSMLTWVEYGFDIGLGVTVTASGLEYPTSDGVRLGEVSIVAALVGAIAILCAQARGMRWLATVSLMSALVAAGSALAFRSAVEGDPDDVLDVVSRSLGLVRLGPGTMVVILGGFVLGVAAVVTLVTPRSSLAVVSSPEQMSAVKREGVPKRRYKIPVPDRAPNWLPDPSGSFEHRFWDGNRWTDRVSRAGVEESDAPRLPGPGRPLPPPG